MDDLKKLYGEHIAFLRREFARVLQEQGWDGVMIHSGLPKQKTVYDDAYWPLRPTPYFAYWVPLSVPDSGLHIAPGAQPILYKNAQKNFWEQPPEPETDHFWNSFDVVEMEDPDLVKEVRPRGKIAFLGEESARASAWGFDEKDRNPQALLKALDQVRVKKTPYEVHCLREANRRAALGHRAVLGAFAKGDEAELDLHLAFLKASAQDDADTPYKNIVACGEHAATLHHVTYSKKRVGAQSILLDAGASYQGYASDVTRTSTKGAGNGVEIFAELVKRLEGMQQALCAQVKPGIPYELLHDRAHEMLAPILRDVGIAKKGVTDEELVSSGTTRKLLPHGLGHSLGLQTHDVGCLEKLAEKRNPFLRNTTVVTEGQVFTIEPGCYFIDALLEDAPHVDAKTVAQLKKFGGVRIEDDLVVTKEGAVNLTREVLP